jgi:hypothetical protein
MSHIGALVKLGQPSFSAFEQVDMGDCVRQERELPIQFRIATGAGTMA